MGRGYNPNFSEITLFSGIQIRTINDLQPKTSARIDAPTEAQRKSINA